MVIRFSNLAFMHCRKLKRILNGYGLTMGYHYATIHITISFISKFSNDLERNVVRELQTYVAKYSTDAGAPYNI